MEEAFGDADIFGGADPEYEDLSDDDDDDDDDDDEDDYVAVRSHPCHCATTRCAHAPRASHPLPPPLPPHLMQESVAPSLAASPDSDLGGVAAMKAKNKKKKEQESPIVISSGGQPRAMTLTGNQMMHYVVAEIKEMKAQMASGAGNSKTNSSVPVAMHAEDVDGFLLTPSKKSFKMKRAAALRAVLKVRVEHGPRSTRPAHAHVRVCCAETCARVHACALYVRARWPQTTFANIGKTSTSLAVSEIAGPIAMAIGLKVPASVHGSIAVAFIAQMKKAISALGREAKSKLATWVLAMFIAVKFMEIPPKVGEIHAELFEATKVRTPRKPSCHCPPHVPSPTLTTRRAPVHVLHVCNARRAQARHIILFAMYLAAPDGFDLSLYPYMHAFHAIAVDGELVAFGQKDWRDFIKQFLLKLPEGARRLNLFNLSFIFLTLKVRDTRLPPRPPRSRS
jgi:hypothetical protein